MATNNQTTPLLALPVELVGRIADSLTPESLLMLRLTCNLLEHLTYDLFSKTFFERRYCCIFYEPRWLLLKNVISSRLGSRVREVTFTIEPLESKHDTDLQLAPNKFDEDMRTAQSIAKRDLWHSTHLPIDVPAWPSTAIFHRVFRDFRRLTSRTLIKLDLRGHFMPESNRSGPLIKAEILLAAVTAGVAIDTLKLGADETRSFKSVLMYLEPELVASTRSLKYFQFRVENHQFDSQFVIKVLKSTNDLRELVATALPRASMATAILRTIDGSRLTTLRIRDALFPIEELIACLSICRSMLHLHLSNVRLSNDDHSWPSIFRTLASIPQLHHLSLNLWDRASRSFRPLCFRGLVHGTTTDRKSMIEYQGREQTAAGLGELLAARLAVVGGPWLPMPSMVGACRICVHDAE